MAFPTAVTNSCRVNWFDQANIGEENILQAEM